jgi:coenzyme F420 hydrogenase subunit beta
MRGDLCTGCGACVALAPGKLDLAMASPGFLRPVQRDTLSDAEEGAISRTCPGLGQKVIAAGRSDSVLWGPYVSMQTGWATDPAVRFAGASGGGLSALLIYLLQSESVDAVIQIAADPEMPIGNVTVVSTDASGVLASAGSRYAASAPLAGLLALVADGRRYAFVGKPCDAAALRAMCDADSKLAAAVPVILSFFCAGVPSQTGGLAVLTALDVDPRRVTNFRYRGNGWPGRATARLDDGSEHSMTYHESWGNILSKHVQHRCKICADGTGVAADLVCGDAWESDAEGYPRFEEEPGISLIVARTTLGAEILAAAQAKNAIETAPFKVTDLAMIQPGQRERRRALWARLAALRLTGRPVPHYEGLQITAAALQNPFSRNIKNFFGTLRRTFRAQRKMARNSAGKHLG